MFFDSRGGKQISLLTAMAYINKDGEKLDPISMVVVSDCMEHSTASVTTCYKKIMAYLKEKCDIEHVHICSDGCAREGFIPNQKYFQE